MDWIQQGETWTAEAICTDCGEAFTVERKRPTGTPPARCRPCFRKFSRERQYRWRQEHPEQWKITRDKAWAKRAADPDYLRQKREREAERVYGLTAEEFHRLLQAQDGNCAICGLPPRGRANGRARPEREPRLHVDHDHTTGRVRGLLCGNCNTMIGLAGEDPKVLLKAVEYLKG